MKRSKRILALFMALLMCLSLLTGAVEYDDAMEMAEEHGEVEAAPAPEPEPEPEPAEDPADSPDETPDEAPEEAVEGTPAEPAEESVEADEAAAPEPAEGPAEDADELPMAADGDAYTYESRDPYITTMPDDPWDQNAVAALERMAFTDFGYDRANTKYFYAKTVDYSGLSSITFKLLMDVPQGMDNLHLFVYGFENKQSLGTNMGLSVVSDGVSVTMTNENGLDVISMGGAAFLLAWGPNSGGPVGPNAGLGSEPISDSVAAKVEGFGYEHMAGYVYTNNETNSISGNHGFDPPNGIQKGSTTEYAVYFLAADETLTKYADVGFSSENDAFEIRNYEFVPGDTHFILAWNGWAEHGGGGQGGGGGPHYVSEEVSVPSDSAAAVQSAVDALGYQELRYACMRFTDENGMTTWNSDGGYLDLSYPDQMANNNSEFKVYLLRNGVPEERTAERRWDVINVAVDNIQAGIDQSGNAVYQYFIVAWDASVTGDAPAQGPGPGGGPDGPGPGFYLRDMEDDEIPAALKAKAGDYEHYAGYAWTADQDGDYGVGHGSYGRAAGNGIDRRTTDYAAFTMKDGVITDSTSLVTLGDSPEGAHLDVNQDGFRFVRENGVDEEYYILLAWNDPVRASDVIESIDVDDVVRYITQRNPMRGFWGSDTEWDEEIEWDRVEAAPDHITVTLKDGRTITGGFGEVERGVREAFEDYDFNVYWTNDETPDHQWQAGAHEAEFGIDDMSVAYDVTVLENPIRSIEVSPVTRLVTDTEERDDGPGTPRYTIVNGSPENVKVVLTDGTVFEGRLWGDPEDPGVQEQLEAKLDTGVDCYWDSDQSESHEAWSVGEHEATLSILGVTKTYKVTVVEDPVATVEVADITRLETDRHDMDGYQDAATGDWIRESWRRIDCWPRDGITVTLKNGKVYTGDGNEIVEKIRQDTGIELDSGWETGETPQDYFTAGHTYQAVFWVGGAECKYDVTVVENPIRSVSAEDVSWVETDFWTEDGYYDRELDQWIDQPYKVYNYFPRSITVDLKNGESFTGDPDRVYDYLAELLDLTDFDMHAESDQTPDNMWEVGGTYPATLYICGLETQYDVTIVESPAIIAAVKPVEVVDSPDNYVPLPGFDEESGEFVRALFDGLDVGPRAVSVTVDGKTYEFEDGEGEPSVIERLADAIIADFPYLDVYWDSEQTPGNVYGVGEHTAWLVIGGERIEYKVTVVSPEVLIQADRVDPTSAAAEEMVSGDLKETEFNSAGKIVDALNEEVQAAIDDAFLPPEEAPNVTYDLYDAKAVLLDENGDVKEDENGDPVEAEAEELPKIMYFILPYPQGVNMGNWNDFEIIILHMIGEGENAGRIERLEGTPTAGGILVALESLSPIYVAKVPQKDLIRHGDINGDGSVNLADAIRLMKYLVAEPNTVHMAYNGNVNSSEDGRTNVADLLRLMRYLNGEDVAIY